MHARQTATGIRYTTTGVNVRTEPSVDGKAITVLAAGSKVSMTSGGVPGWAAILYDKQRRTRPAHDFTFIDYGLLAFRRQVIADAVPAGGKSDLAGPLHDLSVRGQLAGLEISERFYEIGSPAGLEDFSGWLRHR